MIGYMETPEISIGSFDADKKASRIKPASPMQILEYMIKDKAYLDGGQVSDILANSKQ